MPSEDQKYERVSLSEKQPSRVSYESSSTLADLNDLDDLDFLSKRALPWRQKSLFTSLQKTLGSNFMWLVHALLLLTSLTCFAIAYSLQYSTLRHVQQYSAWSPAASAVQYDQVRYNLTTKDNKFVGAGPEVDRAWREISFDMGDQWIPKSALAKLGDPSSLLVNHPSTGEEGYRVGMEVFHQLHCLNLLRKVTYKKHYEPLGQVGENAEALQKHTDHCLEVLRLNLQCNADIGLFTLYMIEGDPLAWPQLNSKHVCRNFEGIRQWAFHNSVGNMEVAG